MFRGWSISSKRRPPELVGVRKKPGGFLADVAGTCGHGDMPLSELSGLERLENRRRHHMFFLPFFLPNSSVPALKRLQTG